MGFVHHVSQFPDKRDVKLPLLSKIPMPESGAFTSQPDEQHPRSLQAHEHAHELYRACPQWCIDWKQRGPGILAEILFWAPDIGCLQEVDHPDEFQAFLEQHG